MTDLIPANPGVLAASPELRGSHFFPVIAFRVPPRGKLTAVTPAGEASRFALLYKSDGRVFSTLAEPEWFDDEGDFESAQGYILMEKISATPEQIRWRETTLRAAGVLGRAAAPLEREGIVHVQDLARQDRVFVSRVRNVSADSLAHLDDLLRSAGLSWKGEADENQLEIPFEPSEESESIL